MVEDLDVAQRLGWASRHLELTRWAGESLPSLSGMRLAATVHIDVKFAVAALRLTQLSLQGRRVLIVGSARSGRVSPTWRALWAVT